MEAATTEKYYYLIVFYLSIFYEKYELPQKLPRDIAYYYAISSKILAIESASASRHFSKTVHRVPRDLTGNISGPTG